MWKAVKERGAGEGVARFQDENEVWSTIGYRKMSLKQAGMPGGQRPV